MCLHVLHQLHLHFCVVPCDQFDGNQCCLGFDVSVACEVCCVLSRLALLSLSCLSLFSFPLPSSLFSLLLCGVFFVVLCCAVLCCAVLCCAVLSCVVLCCAVLCCAVLCCVVLLCVAVCGCVVCVSVCVGGGEEEGDRVFAQNASRVYRYHAHVCFNMFSACHTIHTTQPHTTRPHRTNTHQQDTENTSTSKPTVILRVFDPKDERERHEMRER